MLLILILLLILGHLQQDYDQDHEQEQETNKCGLTNSRLELPFAACFSPLL